MYRFSDKNFNSKLCIVLAVYFSAKTLVLPRFQPSFAWGVATLLKSYFELCIVYTSIQKVEFQIMIVLAMSIF